jgi:hypothetical protein
VTRIAGAIALIVVAAGLFWAGRESTHGLHGFSDHWWCPVPLAMVILGSIAAEIVRRRSQPAAG